MMEDVVLHYRPGSAPGLSELAERTERLLEAFPCRPTPVFAPWFPSAAGCPLPIRPARPPPVIRGWSESCATQRKLDRPGESCARKCPSAAEPPRREPERPPVRPERLPATVLPIGDRTQTTKTSLERCDVNAAGSPVRRSWSVFKQKGVLPRRSPSTLSKHFHHMVTIHRLHPLQRVKWVIGQQNCGTSRNIEQVWQTVSRSVCSAQLPTCNANIQRERAEIWVFCDVLHSEQVGRFLKDKLQLCGTIRLSHHRQGDIFSM